MAANGPVSGSGTADADRVLALRAEDGGKRERGGGGGGGRQEFTALHGNLLLGRSGVGRGAELFGANRADHRGPCLSCQSAAPLIVLDCRACRRSARRCCDRTIRGSSPAAAATSTIWSLPRLVHVAFVRSVHAHALDRGPRPRRRPRCARRGGGADRRGSRRLCKPCRGVLLHYQGMKTGAMLPLAVERVRYVGEPSWSPSPPRRAPPPRTPPHACASSTSRCRPCSRPRPRVAPGAPLIHPELGDNVHLRHPPGRRRRRARRSTAPIASGGAASPPAVTPACPSSRASLVADFEPATRALTVWMSTQVPHMMQAVLADLFGLARASRAGDRPRRRRLVRDQDPRLPGRPGGRRAGAHARAGP